MKYKVADLDGALLDAAVAIAEGRDVAEPVYSAHSDSERDWSPSSEWADGGPIIEREGLDVTVMAQSVESIESGGRPAHIIAWIAERDGIEGYVGPTPLIAAMRAYVASKFGEEVELP